MKRLTAIALSFILAVGLLPAPALAQVSYHTTAPLQAVSISKGAIGKFRVTSEGASCTLDRIALVGGAAMSAPSHGSVTGKTADQIVREMKIGWNLGNTFDAYVGNDDGAYERPDRADIDVERFWGNPATTPEMIQFVQDAGFNAVRIPVSWFQHIYRTDGETYHIDEAWMARVHEVVDYAYSRGMYVTLNTHHEKLWLETPRFGDDGAHREALKAELSAIWRQIATEFKDYDQRLVFEGLNEPRATGEGIDHDREWGSPSAGDLATLNELNQVFVDTVRGVESPYKDTRLLLVPTASASTNLPMITQVKVPTHPGDRTKADPYVGISAHPYVPWWFTNSTDQYQDHTFGARNQVALEYTLYRMYATFASRGVPVVLDEFNAQDFDNTDERVKWGSRYIELARSYGMTCFLWDNGGEGVNAAGNRTAYLDRSASPLAWTNASQQALVDALVAAATDATATTGWRSAFGELEVPGSDGPSGGYQLNDDPFQALAGMWKAFDVRWPLIGSGAIAIEFSGDVPALVATDKNGNGWTALSASDLDPSYVAWNDEVTGGVAYYWPDHVEKLWRAKSVNGVPNEPDDLRQLKVSTTGRSTTVSRIVLSGADVPDVSGGSYGADANVRRLYTRPVTLSYEKDADGTVTSAWNSVAINTENPAVAGKDFAVRFKGDAPYLIFVDMLDDHKWHGWTSVRPYLTLSARDDSGEKVAFFSRDEIDAAWSANRKADGEPWQYDSVSIGVSGGSCTLVELVALGGGPSAHPGADARYQALSKQQIIEAISAGYNLGGHLESRFVPDSSRDGGWGDADLDLEAHWSRGVYINRQTIHDLKERGFKAVRLPITWFQHIYRIDDPANTSGAPAPSNPLERYHIDRAWLDRVHEVVDWCIEEDLFVIVNMHHENWIDRADLDTAYDNAAVTDLPAKFEAVWTQIATEFDGYDQRLVFEDMNEPHAEGDPTDREWNQPNTGDISTVNRLNADFVRIIRSLDPDGAKGHKDRLLMVPTYAASSTAEASTGFVLPNDPSDHLAVSLHCYTPHAYTHYLQNRPESDDGVANVLTGRYRAEIDRAFEGIRARFTDKGYSVVLGEFGCYYCGNERQLDRLRWMAMFITHAKQLGIPCLYWRMDRTIGGEVAWSVYDEVENTWSGLSSALLDEWFALLADEGIAWGSRARIGAGEHAAIDTGMPLVSGTRTVHYDKDDANAFRIAFEATWDQLEGKEIAVKFSGSPLRLGMLAGWSGDWWGIAPAYTDEAAGVAYYSSLDVSRAWRDDHELDELSRLVLRVESEGDATVIDSVALVPIASATWSDWTSRAQADCATEGRDERTRTELDGSTYTQVIANPAWGHVDDGGKVTREATVDAEGELTHTCVVCGTVLSREPIAKLADPGRDPEDDPSGKPGDETGNDPADDPTDDAGDDRPEGPADGSGAGRAEDPAIDPDPSEGPGPDPVKDPEDAPEKGGAEEGLPVAPTVPDAKESYRSVAEYVRVADGKKAYAATSSQVKKLRAAGYVSHGIAFFAPRTGKAVYRLYSKKAKSYAYTAQASQVKKLKKRGFKSQGVAFRSLKSGGVAVRLMRKGKTNLYALACGTGAYKSLKRQGYRSQGVAFRARAR